MLWGGPLLGGYSPPRAILPGERLASSCRIGYVTYTLASVRPAPSGRFYMVESLLPRPLGAIYARPGRGIGSIGCSLSLPSLVWPGSSRGTANGLFLPPPTRPA